jgi:FKBP-type peptidyl-prolyl cis-trans isomerase
MTVSFRRIKRSFIGAVVAALLVGGAACGDNPLSPSEYGIVVTDVVVGSGTEIRLGRGATVFYTLWLSDPSKPEGKGTLVESNVGGQAFSFALGYNQVIPGWDIGIPGMKVGGTRRLVIPPDQAYGSSSSATIPANSTLVFDIQLVGVY